MILLSNSVRACGGRRGLDALRISFPLRSAALRVGVLCTG